MRSRGLMGAMLLAALGAGACENDFYASYIGEGGGGAGGTGAGDTCAGQCVPHEPLGWSSPALLWFGPPGQEPPCPESASLIGYRGNADLGWFPHTCAACSCDPPAATCSLPLGWSAANNHLCPADAPGTTDTSFAAPAGWDGECTAVNAVPAGADCGGEPCVQSLSIPAPELAVGPCAPKVAEPPPAPDVGG